MTRRIRIALACTLAVFGLAVLAGPAVADETPLRAPNSGQLTWSVLHTP
ncbi:hypothetical protein [Amycolatopsis samaneae]|uniref:Uncharacterized protein n=1 Tax=Amycolatopsis samaneae TaxID=664691 RepID=A0ABW5GHY9_9PSEU